MLNTKQCFKCNKTKPITAFYKHKQMADGHVNKCKECNKNDVNIHREKNIDKIRAYDRSRGFRGTRGKVYNKNRESAKGCCMFCGDKSNLEKHHPDYNKPRFIVVLCRSCHRNTHHIVRLSEREIIDIGAFYYHKGLL